VGSIPDSGIVDTEYINRRQSTNQKIKNYCEINNNLDNKRVVFVDIENSIPYFTEHGKKNKLLWDDTLHMTAQGYDRLGSLIYTHIEEYLF
jgi:lysophospholipase L1-like esterase